MTESEATREMTFDEEYEILQVEKNKLFAKEKDEETPFANCVVRRALRCIRKLLKEVKAYRAIGTVEQFEWCKDASHWKGLYKEKLEQYEAIGTIEEFKELKEKAEPKKVLYREQSYGTPWLCPECEADQTFIEFFDLNGEEPKEKHSFCWKCGKKIDWQ